MYPITDEQISTIHDMGKQGIRPREIASAMQLRYSQVIWQLRKANIKPTTISPVDIPNLQALIDQGFSIQGAAKQLGVPYDLALYHYRKVVPARYFASDKVPHICGVCGMPFEGRYDARYCSAECANAARKLTSQRCSLARYYRQKRSLETQYGTCPICGSAFVKYKGRVYCSTRCYRRGYNQRKNEREKQQRRLILTKFCIGCGRQFAIRPEIPLSTQWYCTDDCQAVAKTARSREIEHRRRARFRKAFVAPVSFRKICERDHWTCRLCGQPVARGTKPPDLLAPTLDHIIPLARGGTHEPGNVQLAHFICNSRKSDHTDIAASADGQMRLSL